MNSQACSERPRRALHVDRPPFQREGRRPVGDAEAFADAGKAASTVGIDTLIMAGYRHAA